MSSLNNIYDDTPFQTAGPFLHIGCLPNSIGIKNIFKHDLGMVPFDRKENADSVDGHRSLGSVVKMELEPRQKTSWWWVGLKSIGSHQGWMDSRFGGVA